LSRFLVQRTFQSLVALWLASVVVFAGVRSLPGDPILALSGEGRDPAVADFLRQKYGLNLPLPVQYVRWLSFAVRGDLGTSTRSGFDVTQTVMSRLPTTLEIAAFSMLVALAIGLPAGVLSAVRRGGPLDYVANSIALGGLSVPTFWLGLMLILFVATYLRWLPASGYVAFTEDPVGNLRRVVMPAIVLGSGFGALLMRQVRSAMIEALGSDYVRTARAKGLTEGRVVVVHALRNSLVTVVTVIGLELGALISGSVVTEQIFLIPGFGRLIIEAVLSRDYPVIQAVALFSAAGYIMVNLLVDLLYSVLNPKIWAS
jgi:peptide/nickel transport system permease protein